MTSQEKVFMCDLIKRNYRRRMFWFSMNLVAIIATIFGSAFANTEGSNRPLFLLIAVILLLIYVRNYLVDDDEGSKLPWKIKKAQAKALNEFKNAGFAEMDSSVVLKEYFEV
jgi:hypothetical protein